MPEAPLGSGLARLQEAVEAIATRGLPPVERWNPAFCGDIDMRIAADGSWHYMGSPIRREKLVRLFSTVLRRDEDGYRLVTPVEKLGIAVDDLPFVAVEMAVDGEGEAASLSFRTNVGDVVTAGPDHALRFDDADGAFKPAVHVRGGLWARLTRALALDLADRGAVRGEKFGVMSGGVFFPAAEASGIGAGA